MALVLATLWGSESLAQSAAPVAKVRYLSNFQVAPRFGDRRESGASCPLAGARPRVRLLNRLPTLGLGGGDYSSCPIAAVHIRSEDCWGDSEAVIRSGHAPKASLARYGRYHLNFRRAGSPCSPIMTVPSPRRSHNNVQALRRYRLRLVKRTTRRDPRR